MPINVPWMDWFGILITMISKWQFLPNLKKEEGKNNNQNVLKWFNSKLKQNILVIVK